MAPRSQPSADAPPRFLSIAGHPLRWRLLTTLAHSDRTVDELVRLVDVPQNLVSYHLRMLREVGFVAARRSSADGRDMYYSADLTHIRDALATTGPSLHPGIQLLPSTGTPPEPHDGAAARQKVLFLCTGNSARSQMAEALVTLRSGGRAEASSAGSNPKPIHPHAVSVMRQRYGVDISGATSKHLDTVMHERFDRVITLCDRVREVCPELPGKPRAAHWSFADPTAGGDDRSIARAFEQLAVALDARIEFLLLELQQQRTAA